MKAPKGMHYILLEFDKNSNRVWVFDESSDLKYIAALADHIMENPREHLHYKASCLQIMCVGD